MSTQWGQAPLKSLEELFKGVPSRDEIISLTDNERVCDECGAALEPISKEFVRHEFRFTPAKGEVVNIYRETYKCPACSTADAMEENIKFVKAAVPEALIPNSYASQEISDGSRDTNTGIEGA